MTTVARPWKGSRTLGHQVDDGDQAVALIVKGVGGRLHRELGEERQGDDDRGYPPGLAPGELPASANDSRIPTCSIFRTAGAIP